MNKEINKRLEALGLNPLFREFLAGSPGLAYIRDADGRTIYINPAYERTFGISLAESEGKTPSSWLSADQAHRQEVQDRSVIESGQPVVATVEDRTSTGDPRFWHVHRFPLTSPTGEAWVAGWIYDVSGDLLKTERLTVAEEQITRLKVLEDALDGIAQLSQDWSIEYANARLISILGVQDLIGMNPRDLVHEDDVRVLEAARHRLESTGRAETECRFVTKSPEIAAWIKLIRDDVTGKIYLFVHDTTLQREFQILLEESLRKLHDAQIQLAARQAELEEANCKLQVLATTDGLTGLLNHRKFQEELADLVTLAERYDQPFSVLLLDIDHFKQYNDSYGHPAGDDALRQVAQVLKSVARSTDEVARYGGEEFAVLLRMTDKDGAKNMADRFRAAIEAAHWPNRPVTASLGASSYGTSGTSAASLIDSADHALYAAKKAGRNCFRHADEL
jgi:diguanylate cyclase (GGDEF)-like protein/PAS domain S-box-containing protein